MQKDSKKRTSKKKIAQKCYFTETGTTPDYKDVVILRRFVSDRGKILPQSKTGLTAKNQRLLSKAIKQARYMSLLPYTDRHAN